MSQLTLWGHASRVPGRGWRGAVPPLTPPTATAYRGRWTRRVGEDSRQRGGACRVARQGALRRVDAVGSGAPVGGPGARIGNNLNQIARWANTFASEAEAVEVVAEGLSPPFNSWPVAADEAAGQPGGQRRRDSGDGAPHSLPRQRRGKLGVQRGAEPPLARPQCSTLRGLAHGA